MQRIPVRLEVEPNQEAPKLRAGMTVTVSIDTGRERDVYALLENLMGPARAMGLGLKKISRRKLPEEKGSDTGHSRNTQAHCL